MKNTDDIEIAANLRVVMARLMKILRNKVNEDELLSLTERSSLSLVYQSTGMLPSELADKEKVTSQSMSQIINKLYRMGFINKTPSGEDKRKVIITIAATGKKYLEKKRHEKQEWLAQTIFERTNQKEKETLARAIKVLTKLVELQ